MGSRTYWHLEKLDRKPTDYDIATSRLLYYVDRGFETDVAVRDWYERYGRSSSLRCSDWESFSDPQKTTYAEYTRRQSRRETFIDELLRHAEQQGYDDTLSAGWHHALASWFWPLRYPMHGLQMVAAYVGQMAPSSPLVVVLLFQTADEIRRIQRLAYRTRQLSARTPHSSDAGKAVWQNQDTHQPLRRVIERLLVTYDWGEALIALNLVVKPMFDELFMSYGAHAAKHHGDSVLEKMLRSLNEDCIWHRQWTQSLLRMLLHESESNQTVVSGWMDKWHPPMVDAVQQLAPLFQMPDSSDASRHVDDACREFWTSVGVRSSEPGST